MRCFAFGMRMNSLCKNTGGGALANAKGAAALELAAALPLLALFILLVVQFSAVFTQSIRDLAVASAEASRTVADWNMATNEDGFARPCLELMPVRHVSSGGNPLEVGAGLLRRMISVPQEVHIVAEDICSHRQGGR